MKKVMESPEVKAQMEQNRSQDQKLENQYYAAISKILYPRQRATLKKMLGAPFDRSALGMGGPWGGGPPRGNQASSKNGTATGKGTVAKSEDDDGESASPAAPATKAPAKTKPATATRRKSLRELRGSSSDSDE